MDYIKKIEKEIRYLREKLNELIEEEKNGLIDVSKEIMQISKQLDKLILEYYKNGKDLRDL